MHKKQTNRLLATVLSIVMILSLVVIPAGAATPMGDAAVAETPAEAAGSAGLSAARPAVNTAGAELLAADATQWVFDGDDHSKDTFEADADGLVIANAETVQYHNTGYGLLAKPKMTEDGNNIDLPATVGIPVDGPSKITVYVGYTWDIALGDAQSPERYGRDAATSGNNGSRQAKVFNYFGGAGYATLTAAATTSTYIAEIKVEALDADANVQPYGPVDVWDVGAEELDATMFNNLLSADIVKSWFADVPSENVGNIKVDDFEVLNSKNVEGAEKWDTRVRTTNEAIGSSSSSNITKTQVDVGEDIYDLPREKYWGSLQNNGGLFTVKMAAKAGDKLTMVFGEGNNSGTTLVFTDPAGETTEFVKTDASGSVASGYATQEGTATFANTTNKMNIARVYREHATKVTVSGALAVGSDVPAGYKLVLTDNDSGVKYTATTTASGWSAEVNNYLSGTEYTLSVEDAVGVIVTVGEDLSVPAGVKTVDHAVTIAKVDLVDVSGAINGLSADAMGKLAIEVKQPEGKLYVPVATVDVDTGAGTATWSAQLEKDETYTLTAKYVNDYALQTATVVKSADATDADLTFAAKDTYAVTIVPDPASVVLDEADTITFTNLLEAGEEENEAGTPYDAKGGVYHYVYTFAGNDTIQLRDGTYNVVVTTTKGVQKLTSNLKVDGAVATKTVKFDVEPQYVPELPKTSLKSPDSENIKGITWTDMESRDGHGMTNRYNSNENQAASFTLNLEKAATVTVETCTFISSGKLAINGTELTSDVDEAGAEIVAGDGENGRRFTIEAEAGELTIDVSGTYLYIDNITVAYASSGTEKPFYGPWDLKAGPDELGAAIQNGTGTSKGLGIDATAGTNCKWSPRTNGDTQANAGVKVTVPVDPAADGKTVSVKVTFYPGQRSPIKIGETTYGEAKDTDELTIPDVAVADGSFVMEITENCYLYEIEVTNPHAVVPEPGADMIFEVGSDKTYKTVQAAVDAAAEADRSNGERAIISIDPGNYYEMVWVRTPNVTFKNASANPSIALKNKGVDIDENAVRISWYYGCGYDYFSMGANSKFDAEQFEINKENGYPSHLNSAGGGKNNECWWNASVVIAAKGFEAEGIIFENSFNQYISEAEAADTVLQGVKDCPEVKNNVPTRTTMTAGDTTVQKKKYVERAAALALTNAVDKAYFENCAFVGHQDILFGDTGVNAAFYDCDLFGACDYIMGPMHAVFAKCDLVLNVGADDDKNDVSYITAPQQSSGRGYLMWGCNVRSVVPGVESAGTAVTAVQHAFGRAWSGATAEALFYETTVGVNRNGESLISAEAWNIGLGSSKHCYEYRTHESATEYDHSSRIMGGVLTDGKTFDGVTPDPTTWLGYNPFEGKTLDDICPDPTAHVPTGVTVTGPENATSSEAVSGTAGTIQLTAVVAPATADQAVTWTSDSDVVTVDETGLVTVPATATAGTVTITATALAKGAGDVDVKATYTITIKESQGDDPVEDPLAAAIKAAEDEAESTYVSEDGTDVSKSSMWVAQGVMDTFQDAIDAAKAVAEDENATTAEKAAAVDALNAAMDAFKEAQKAGTKASIGKPAYGQGTTPDGEKSTTTTTTNPDGSVVTTVKDKDGNLDITVKAEDGEVLAEIKLPATVGTPATAFVDVPEGHWAAKCINDMAALGMVKGVNEDGTIFDMNSPITRGSIATILYRLSNGAAGKTSTFADVAADSWYGDAIGWAANAKLITGYDETTFGPDDTITRQQLAVMIARMARMMGIDTSAHDSALEAFTDGADTAEWAADGMAWCVKAGIVLGKDGERLDPAAAVTRAEAATMIDRMIGLLK